MQDLDVVTGAYSYTGKYITRRLLAAGRQVRTITNHPPEIRPPEFADVEAVPYDFSDHGGLADAMAGAHTFYNTYWVRFSHGNRNYEDAVHNTRTMIEAAEDAGVHRIVHVSITKPSHDSPFEYFRGKAEIEDMIRHSSLSHAIVRPTVVFGAEDILVNNVAWLLRHLHLFAIPGSGDYGVRPVYVDDLAELCVCLGSGDRRGGDTTVNAVGPESFTFEEFVRTIARIVGTHALIVHLPPQAVMVLLRILEFVTGDKVLTADEMGGMMADLVRVDGEATCPTRFTDWATAHHNELGGHYHSEIERHFK